MNYSSLEKHLNSEELNSIYALTYMNNYLESQIRKEIVGTSQLVLSLNKLKELKIQVPSIEEQNRIVEKLDLIFEQIDNLNTKNNKLVELYNSSFLDFFGNPNDNPKKYDEGTINDICSSIVRGPFGSSLKKEFFVDKGINTYKVYEQEY